MDIKFSKNGTTLTAHLSGELDQHTAGGVRAAIEAAVRKENISRLILDLRELSFMDSSGLGVFIGIHHVVAAFCGEMELLCKEGIIPKMAEMAGLQKLMNIRVGGSI